MILDVTTSTLPEIKNSTLREYSNIYVQIYQNFMDQVQDMGLEIEAEDASAAVAQRIAELQKKARWCGTAIRAFTPTASRPHV